MGSNRRLQQGEVVCSGCGKVMPSSLEYCSNCGKKLLVKVEEEEKKPVQEEALIEKAWPMLRRDPSCTGSDGSVLQAPLEKTWEFQAGGDIESPLAAAYGMVFFGCKDKCVYAVDAISGEKRWMFKTGGGIVECPVAADDVVYVASKDKNLYAIEAKSGQKRWQFSAREEISTLAVANGMVYFGCKDKNVYALDATTGQKKWEFNSDFKDYSAPIPFEGKVLISGSGFRSKRFFALDATNGSVLWELKDYKSDECPVVVGGNILVARAPKDHLAKIDLASGNDLGELFPKLARNVVRSNDFIFVTFSWPSPGLYAVDLSRPRVSFTGWDWIAPMEDVGLTDVVSMPAAAGDFVFVAVIGKKQLYGINIKKFMKRWVFSLNENVKFSPIVADGMMFVASEKGKLHAFRSAKDPQAVTILEYISGEIASAPKFKTILYNAQFIWPNYCCLCCGPAEKNVELRKEEGKLVLTLPNLPYCTSCYDKTHKLFGREKPGVEISKVSPPIIAFRNEKYWAMFMEANRIR